MQKFTLPAALVLLRNLSFLVVPQLVFELVFSFQETKKNWAKKTLVVSGQYTHREDIWLPETSMVLCTLPLRNARRFLAVVAAFS